MSRVRTAHSRCAAPNARHACVAMRPGTHRPIAPRSGAHVDLVSGTGRQETMHACAICVLLCTTRESARLSRETGLFNLRLSSDAPNFEVENEETIEALSARTKALLEGIQQRFLFVRSIRADSYRFVRLDNRISFFLSISRRGSRAPNRRMRPHQTGEAFARQRAIAVFAFFSPCCFARCVSTTRMRSFLFDRCGLARLAAPFSKIIDFCRPMSRQLQRAFSRNASGDQ